MKRKKISQEVRDEVWRSYEGRCYYCGTLYLDALTWYEVDHLIPHSQGGTNDFENLRPACRACNRMKADLNVEVFRRVAPLTALELHTKLGHLLNIFAWNMSLSEAGVMWDAHNKVGELIIPHRWPAFFGEKARWVFSDDSEFCEAGLVLGLKSARGFYRKLFKVLNIPPLLLKGKE